MKNIKYTLMALLYANTILFLCSCVVYASGYHQHRENMKIKKAAAQVFDFPEIKIEEAHKVASNKKRKTIEF